MAKPGRKSKYTPERIEKILDLLRLGNTRGTAATVAGVRPETFCEWLNRYPNFANNVKEAEESAVAAHVANITRAGARGQWQASAWYLERRHYTHWGRKDRIEVVNTVREQARNAGVDESEAVQAAEDMLRELRSNQRA